ncbi:TetR/AcrR family transcriptional regulator [Nocardia harenae]|uniref:TetR/AcrR family transcriptional regulator n=1 Tax=Nocardia harenae TaxID=358707 RepID=UPI0008307B95|nr:TetR/AcrR family transcriptional regulator [Nocardia harenae]
MASTAAGAPAAPASGRPRDPDVDRRVYDAAMAVFGEVGWAGFSMVAVARRAGAGKASVYLRWPNKTDLLIDAVRARVALVTDPEFDDVRTELLSLTRQMLAIYLPDGGRAALRLSLEAHLVPGLAEHYREVSGSQVIAVRAIVRRAIDRGELPPETSVTLLLDALCGAAMMHAQAAPPQLRERQLAAADSYAEQLVDFVLAATGARHRR